MDVLLTWNCKHMANIVELPKTVRVVTQAGYECPMIITPKDYLEKRNLPRIYHMRKFGSSGMTVGRFLPRSFI